MIENVSEVIQNFLTDEDYKVLGVDENDTIFVRYQMTDLCIIPNKNRPNFVSILIPDFDSIDEEDPLPTIFRCMRLVSSQMVVKAYPENKDTIVATYEFFFNNEEDLCFQIENGLDALMDLTRKYRLLKQKDEEEAEAKKKENENDDIDWEEVGGNDNDDDPDDDDEDEIKEEDNDDDKE